MTLSNCTLFKDTSLSLSQIVDKSANLEDLEEKVVPNLYLIAAGVSGNTYLWPAFKQDVFVDPCVTKVHESPCMFIDNSSYCNLIATCSQDHKLSIWKTNVSSVCSD